MSMTGKEVERGHEQSKEDEKKKKLLEQLKNVRRAKEQQNSKDALKNMTIKVDERKKINEETVNIIKNESNKQIAESNGSELMKKTELKISNFTAIGLETEQYNNHKEELEMKKNGILNKNIEEGNFSEISSIKKKEEENSMKRPLNKLTFTDELRNELNLLEKESQKKKKLISPEKYNDSTCIEISSSESDENAKRPKISIIRGSKTEEKLRNVNEKAIEFEHDQNESKLNHHIESFGLTNPIFSKVKLTYVYLNTEIVSKLRKEKRRLYENNLIEKISDLKVNLQSTFVNVAKTAPISMIIEKIKIQEKIFSDVKNYRFYAFKGTQNDLRETILNSLLKEESFIKSQRFINLQRLYEWYTLAHVLSCSSNIVIAVEKSTEFSLIEDFYNFRCYCKNVCLESCLCLQFWVCRRKDSCSQRTLGMIERHEKICRYSRPYKQMSFKEEYLAYSERGPVGLRNDQNSCFMNTALQCLVACEPLTEFFLENEHLKNINLGNHFGTFGEITTRYVEFLREYFTTKKSVIDTDKFKRALCRWDNKYLDDQQEDSQEFLIQLLDWLKEDLNLNKTRPKYIETENNELNESETKAEKAWKTQLARHDSIIEYLMAGVLKSEIECTECSYKSENFENFLTLPLPVIKSKPNHRWSFDIKVSIVYENFKKKNETAVLRLESFRYKDALKEIKSTFGLKSDSELIGICYDQLNSSNIRIINEAQGREELKKLKDNPKQKLLLFYEHKREELSNPSKFIEIRFSIKLKLNEEQINLSCPRYLFLSKKEGSGMFYVYARLLSYFYSMMFKEKNQMSEKEYLEKYLKPENIPFKVYLSKENQEIFMEDNLSLKNEAEIDVVFENEELFNCREASKSIFIKKPNKLQENFEKEQDSKMTIYDSLKEFQSTDVMDFDNCWNCPKCKEKRKSLKRISIYKAPKVLILFFKRFASTGEDYSHEMRKLENFVTFSENLNLEGYVEKEELPYTSEKRPLTYKLFAIANHFSLSSSSHGESGHYTAYVKKRGEWFYINDERVGLISKEDICSKNAYMLFYLRQ